MVNPAVLNRNSAIPGNGIRWRDLFFNRRPFIEFSISLIIQAAALMFLADFLKFIERRDGSVLNDPLLSLFSAADLTWLIFALIYGCLFLALFSFAKNPRQLVMALQSYTVLILFRIAAMSAAPFNPPAGMIPLSDPFVEFFGTGMLLTKDLFFSGHTALLFLFFLIEKTKVLKILFLSSAVIVGICLLIQHVHYTIDVLTAPFFAFAAFKLMLKLKHILRLSI